MQPVDSVAEIRLHIHSDIDFGTDPIRWYQESADAILDGRLPRYNILGDWIYYIEKLNPEVPLESGIRIRSVEIIDRIKYYATIAYLELLSKENMLRTSIDSLDVLSDTSIIAEFGSYAHVVEYKKILNEMIDSVYDNRATPETRYNFLLDYTVFRPSTFKKALILRWHLLNKYPDLFPLIVDRTPDPLFEQPSSEQIANSSEYDPDAMDNIDDTKYAVIIKGYRNGIVNEPNSKELQIAEDDLIQQLRNYYEQCDILSEQSIQNFRKISTKLDQLTLEELISVIPITSPKSKKQICIYSPNEYRYNNTEEKTYLRPSLKNIKKSTDTINYGMLDDESYLRRKYLILGLKGYFTIGPIRGYLTQLSPNGYSETNVRDLSSGEVSETKGNTIIESRDLGIIDVVRVTPSYALVDVIFNIDSFLNPETMHHMMHPTVLNDELEPALSREGRVRRNMFKLKLDSDNTDKDMEHLLDDVGLLWDKEWFLSPWAKNVASYLGKISSAPFKLNPRFKYSFESVLDSERITTGLRLVADLYENGMIDINK